MGLPDFMRVSTSLGAEHDILVKLGRIVHFSAAVASMLTGIIHIFALFEVWCNDAVEASGQGCVGPWLIWNKEERFTFDANAAGYRTVFTLNPVVMVDIWTPFIFGVFSMMQHVASLKRDDLTSSWPRVALYYFFGTFFANLGFAGNWGIMAGLFITPFCMLVFIAMAWLRPQSGTSMDMVFGGESGPKSGENDWQNVDDGQRYVAVDEDAVAGGTSFQGGHADGDLISGPPPGEL